MFVWCLKGAQLYLTTYDIWENFLFDIVLKSVSRFDLVKNFLSNLTSKLYFLPETTLSLVTLGLSINFSFAGPQHPFITDQTRGEEPPLKNCMNTTVPRLPEMGGVVRR
jgi:hypothetical protein